MPGIATAHHILDTTVSLISIFLNLRLFELIWRHSEFKVKAYKWILLITCVGDLCLGLVVLIGQPAILFGDGYMVAVANGFFAHKSPIFDHICASVYCALLHTNITCVVVQFVFRYRLICGHENPFGNPLLFIVPIVWCLHQGFNAAWCFVIDDSEELRQAGLKILQDYGWHYSNLSIPYPAVSSNAEWKTRVHHLVYMISLIYGYGTIIWCEYRIIKFFNQYGASVHESTRKAHAEVNRAVIALTVFYVTLVKNNRRLNSNMEIGSFLTIFKKAVTPLFTSMGPTMFVVGSMSLGMGQSLPMVFVFVSMGMTFITVANPITTIYFVKPYRKALLNSIGFKCKNNSVVTSSTNPSNESAPTNSVNTVQTTNTETTPRA